VDLLSENAMRDRTTPARRPDFSEGIPIAELEIVEARAHCSSARRLDGFSPDALRAGGGAAKVIVPL
jgi:hypothetical protein